ncbi:MAG: DUF47 family protein [Anaerolineaceae bacterium]|nr:DUF47 family protein [Anaerolineaceae bacterium]
MSSLFKKRQNKFIKHIHNQATATLAGMEALIAYFKDKNPKSSAKLTKIEEEGDEYRRILINELNKTFITPFDREDIFALSRTIDDVLDYAYSTAVEVELLKVKPTSKMQGIAKLLRDAANELLMAVDRLEDHPGVANEHAQRAKAIENKIEMLYREALAELFKGVDTTKHVMKVFKYREIYRHLSNAGDRGDEAANVIASIIMKMS